MIYTFNPVIYPRKVWMTYDATSEELNEMFPTGDANENRFNDEDEQL